MKVTETVEEIIKKSLYHNIGSYIFGGSLIPKGLIDHFVNSNLSILKEEIESEPHLSYLNARFKFAHGGGGSIKTIMHRIRYLDADQAVYELADEYAQSLFMLLIEGLQCIGLDSEPNFRLERRISVNNYFNKKIEDMFDRYINQNCPPDNIGELSKDLSEIFEDTKKTIERAISSGKDKEEFEFAYQEDCLFYKLDKIIKPLVLGSFDTDEIAEENLAVAENIGMSLGRIYTIFNEGIKYINNCTEQSLPRRRNVNGWFTNQLSILESKYVFEKLGTLHDLYQDLNRLFASTKDEIVKHISSDNEINKIKLLYLKEAGQSRFPQN